MSAFPASFDLATLDGNSGFPLAGGPGSNGFGYSIVTLGDVNGDGFADLAINSFGRELVWLGKTGPFAASTIAGNEFPFETRQGNLPDNMTEYDSWIVGIGDVNGDGFADFDHHAFYVTETEFEYEYNDSWTEIVFYEFSGIQYGSNSGTATAGIGFGDSGLEHADSHWLSPIGDVNGDGFGDVAVYRNPGFGGSATRIVFGSADGLPGNTSSVLAPGLSITGDSAREINPAGDFNGDGIDDFVVETRYSPGETYLVFGRADLGAGVEVNVDDLDGTDGIKLTGQWLDGRVVGDVNGDGLDDILLRRSSSTTFYVVYGRSDGAAVINPDTVDGTGGFRIEVDAGWVSAAGDINGDGLDDFVIGGDGSLYVVFSRPDIGAGGLDATSVDGDNGFQIVATGMNTTGSWGLTGQAAGDVNGDGIDDLVVGTAGENAVHVILGHAATAVTWTGTSARENHGGSHEDDSLNGAGGNDYLRGLGGDDLLIGGPGGDRLDGGEGNDTASFATTSGGVVVDLAAGTASGHGLGNDVLVSIEHVIGTGGADDISGTARDNRLDGGPGADRLAGRAGNDTYVVDNAGDVVVETRNQGTDTVETTLAGYTLGADIENVTFIGTGSFSATGNTLGNIIQGGAGDDELNGGRGQDTLRGGLGNDTYVVDHPGDVIEDTGGIDTIETTLNYALGADFENLVLRGTGAISGTGNALANVMTGNTGNNTLIGLGGDDTLKGGNGDDKMLGGDGNDTLNATSSQSGDHDILRGGLGDDTYIIFDGNDVVSEADGGGIDTVMLRAAGSYTLGSGVENLQSHTSGGVLTGNSLNNIISAGARGDNDTLNGMRGDDVLSGRGGADTFVFGTGFGHDRITDFSSADIIRFEAGLFADFADVMAHATQAGTQVVITWNAGNSVTLDGYRLANLAADDFLFA